MRQSLYAFVSMALLQFMVGHDILGPPSVVSPVSTRVGERPVAGYGPSGWRTAA
jgi:hypothetical protein